MTTVTDYDREERYESETLKQSLDAQDSLRHACRVAHLYLSRAPLSEGDLAVELPRLVDKVFGVPEGGMGASATPVVLGPGGQRASAALADHGWLFRVKNARDAPRLCGPELRSNLLRTLRVDQPYSREQLGAFRLYQLLDPDDRGNLFELAFRRSAQDAVHACVYALPAAFLPPYAAQALAAAEVPDQRGGRTDATRVRHAGREEARV